MHLGKNISHLRKVKKISQNDLARMVGKTAGAISSYERDAAEPTAGVIMKLAEVFGVSIDELVFKDLTRPDAEIEGTTPNMEQYAKELEAGTISPDEVISKVGDRDLAMLNKLMMRRIHELEESIRKNDPDRAKELGID